MDPATQEIMILRFKEILLKLGDFQLELNIELRHAVTAIFGPSGAGKTSLLDLVAGLRHPQSAFIELAPTVLTDTKSGIQLPARQRRIGYVPQDLALFPHLSVKQNIVYGARNNSEAPTVFTFDHVVDVLEIRSLLDRSVGQLSGGEKQRVSLARALLSSPRLLLLDEPLASLDAGLKTRLIAYLRRVRTEFPVPMLYVTHDPDEVVAMCDEVVALDRGKCIAQGPPSQIFANRPQPTYTLKT